MREVQVGFPCHRSLVLDIVRQHCEHERTTNKKHTASCLSVLFSSRRIAFSRHHSPRNGGRRRAPPTLELVQNAARLEDIATGPPTKDDGAACSAALRQQSLLMPHCMTKAAHCMTTAAPAHPEDEEESCSDGKDWGVPPPPGKLVRQVTPPNGLVIPPIASKRCS